MFRRALGFCLLFALLKLGGAAATTGLIALLCLWALLGKRQALEALALMVVVKSLNPSLYAYSAAFGPLCVALTLLAGLRILLTAGFRGLKPLPPILAFCLVVALLGAARDNPNWDVSAMKLFMFGYGGATLLAGFASLNDRDAERMASWLINITATVILLSLAALPFKGIAYGGFNGFRGILGHPQTLGPVLAPITCWILAGMLFHKGSRLVIPVAISLVLIAMMILSQARTSVVAMALSLCATFLVAAVRKKTFTGFRLGRSLGLSMAVLMISAVSLSASPGLRNTLTNFVFKYHSKTLDKALSSRSEGVAAQWNNFLEHPWAGNGFGVYADGVFPSGVVRVMGIPISAPVEKGFMPTAVLEETGVIGTLSLFYLLASMARRVIRIGDPRWMAMFFACLFVNVGEMVFFSLGGIGLYFWLLMGLCTRMGTADAIKLSNPSRRITTPIPITSPAPISTGI